ncbi:hypothetical protein QE152_g29648 [Popillia japonica]|uniref:Uncharacterized protein n=1 Tax=Popillia japonica TaxID=7064 RepID=A0AAW1JHM8_POPJA
MTKYLADEQLANFSANVYSDIDGIECAGERDGDLSDALSEHNDHDTTCEFEVKSEDKADEDLGDDGRNRYE